MKFLTLTTVAAFALVSFGAQAHGPTRKKVEETVEINAAPDKVWAVIGNFQDMSWLPPVEKTEGSQVFAGTVSRGGFLQVLAIGIGADTTLARIIPIFLWSCSHLLRANPSSVADPTSSAPSRRAQALALALALAAPWAQGGGRVDVGDKP